MDLEDGKFLMAKDLTSMGLMAKGLTSMGAYIAANFSSTGAVVVGSLLMTL